MAETLELDKTTTVHLTANGEMCNRLARGTRITPVRRNGEMCNRLARGTRITPVRRKGDWVKITWRKGKKKGWIFSPNPSIKIT
jgi:hypothetical protein